MHRDLIKRNNKLGAPEAGFVPAGARAPDMIVCLILLNVASALRSPGVNLLFI